jgi:hypothetical protein
MVGRYANTLQLLVLLLLLAAEAADKLVMDGDVCRAAVADRHQLPVERVEALATPSLDSLRRSSLSAPLGDASTSRYRRLQGSK